MRENLPTVLRLSTNNEGGYSNHPSDPGGPTNHGITQATLSTVLRRPATIADVKRLTLASANVIYEKLYAAPLQFDKLPSGLDYAMFDYGINSGTSRAVKEIQKIVGTGVDGVMGPKTLAAITARDPADLVRKLCDARLKFMKGLKTWPKFGRGWQYRVIGIDPKGVFARKPGVLGDSLAMVRNARPAGLAALFPVEQLTAIMDEMPLAKASQVDTKVLAPMRNKVQAIVVGTGGVGGLIQAASQYVSPWQVFAAAIEPYKDEIKFLGVLFIAISVSAAAIHLAMTLHKIREEGGEAGV